MVDRDGPPWITFPERLDRPLRLGPFPSGKDAVKFVVAAAVGAVVSLAIVPWAGLPIVAVGGLVALWRPDGEPLDERVAAVLRWASRRGGPGGRMTGPAGSCASSGQATVVVLDGRSAAVVRTGGVPLAFLPPAELAQQFELYRQLLRSVDGGVIVHATSAPIYAEAIVPRTAAATDAEAAARDGYRELVTVLARRRAVRRVHVAIVREAGSYDAAERLEASVSLLQGRLADLGVRSERLRGRQLGDASRRMGLLEGTVER